MSQAISNSLAYAAPNGDYRSLTSDVDNSDGQAVQLPQQPETSQRSPATVVSLGSHASGADTHFSLPDSGPTQSGVAHLSERDIELRHLNAEIKGAEVRLKARDAFAQHFEAARASYDKIANTPPKAALALGAKETAEVVKKALSLGYDPLGGKDNYMFGWEGKVYTFMADGSATVHEEGVATSVEQQQAAIEARKQFLARATDPMTDVTNARNALTAQRDALLGATVERIA